MAQQIVELKKFSKEIMTVLLRDRAELTEGYNAFMKELKDVSKEFGYENPAEFGKTAEILNREKKFYNERLNYMNNIIEQGGVKITKDISKLNASIERLHQLVTNHDKDIKKYVNGEM